MSVAQVRCADGRVLAVCPVPVVDRQGVTYEVTLRLLLDGAPFGDVGECCGHALAGLRERLRDAPPGELPPGLVEQGVRAVARATGTDPDTAWELARHHLPRDVDLLVLRARDPDDVSSSGALRVHGVTERRFVRGAWQARTDVLVEAWGDAGTGVRAVVDVAALGALLDALLSECSSVGARYAT